MNISIFPPLKFRGWPIPRIGELLAHLHMEQRIRRDLRYLEGMNDSQLRDIGIRREDIPFAVRHGRVRAVPASRQTDRYSGQGETFPTTAATQPGRQMSRHSAPIRKKNLAGAFNSFAETWSPRIAGQVGEMQIKLTKFERGFVWHHHADEDELFLVHRGRLMMRFRDRDEILEQGEFIVVPRGVEHCPVALSPVCEVVLLEPATTRNTGNVVDERTVIDLGRI